MRTPLPYGRYLLLERIAIVDFDVAAEAWGRVLLGLRPAASR